MNKKIHAALISVLSVVLPSFAQSNFQHIISGPLDDRAQTFFQTSDSDFVVNGASFSYGVGDVDLVFLKLNPSGQILWSNAYGTANYDNCEYAFEASDHSIVGAGRSNLQPGVVSSIIFKLDS